MNSLMSRKLGVSILRFLKSVLRPWILNLATTIDTEFWYIPNQQVHLLYQREVAEISAVRAVEERDSSVT